MTAATDTQPGIGIPDPGRTPFSSASTAAEVVAGLDLGGRRAVITGGASGIGAETARALAAAGASVTLAVRDTTAGQEAAGRLRASTGNHDITVAPLDLAHPRSEPTIRASDIVPFRLDRCLVRGLRCADTRTLDRGASDHHPIVVELMKVA